MNNNAIKNLVINTQDKKEELKKRLIDSYKVKSNKHGLVKKTGYPQ